MRNLWGMESASCVFTMGLDYRIYFQKRGDTIIVLLCGGNKSTQAKDIKTAKRLAEAWSK